MEVSLNSKCILEISEHIVSLQKEYNFNYSAHMTTNAYILDKSMFERFVKLGIDDYQITLDGTAETHNTTRKKINGGGTFDTIWSNLCSYKQIEDDFNIVFRLHVMQENSESMMALSHMIKQQFGEDSRYMSFIRNIANLGGATKDSVDKYVPDQQKSVDSLIGEMRKVMASDSHTSYVKKGDSPYICYAARPRHLTIRADGRLAKCTVMFDDDRNDIGRINVDGSLDIDGEKFDVWTRGFSSLNLKELACPKTNLPALKPKGELIEVVVI